MTRRDYMDRIRGGQVFYQLRVADRPVTACGETLDILLALNRRRVRLHLPHLKKQGLLLFNGKTRERGFGKNHCPALSQDCGFVARAFAGGPGLVPLKEILKQAIRHPGFALVDILQNCISFKQ